MRQETETRGVAEVQATGDRRNTATLFKQGNLTDLRIGSYGGIGGDYDYGCQLGLTNRMNGR